MKGNDDNKILHLFKNNVDFDPIHSRLCSVSDLFNSYEEDPMLELAHNKVLEAIDWYERYLDSHRLLDEHSQEKLQTTDKQEKME